MADGVVYEMDDEVLEDEDGNVIDDCDDCPCGVDCVSNGGAGLIERQLNVKLTAHDLDGILSDQVSVLPGPAIWDGSSNWSWAAGTLPNRYPLPGSGASLGDSANTLDATDLLCLGSAWSNSHNDIGVWNSSGSFLLANPNAFSVISSTPGAFYIRFFYFMEAQLGLTYYGSAGSGVLWVDFYE